MELNPQIIARSRSISFDYGIIDQNDEYQEFEKKWKDLSSSIKRIGELDRLREEYAEISKKHPSFAAIPYNSLFGNTSPGFSLWMPGISLLAAYLTKKKKLEGLFVCASQEALKNQVKHLITTSKKGRWAIVFPSWEERPIHKSTLVIEKNGSDVKIAYLDSLAPVYDYENSILTKVAEICRNQNCKTKLFHSEVKREFTNYGCAIFALQDSVSFLQDPLFFSKIARYSYVEKVEENPFFEKMKSIFPFLYGFFEKSNRVQILSDLPPEYMIGMQSTHRLEKYIESHKESFLPLPKRKKTLKEYQKKYAVSDLSGTIQNHYITHKMFKYMWFCVTALKELPSSKIQELINSTLVV